MGRMVGKAPRFAGKAPRYPSKAPRNDADLENIFDSDEEEEEVAMDRYGFPKGTDYSLTGEEVELESLLSAPEARRVEGMKKAEKDLYFDELLEKYEEARRRVQIREEMLEEREATVASRGAEARKSREQQKKDSKKKALKDLMSAKRSQLGKRRRFDDEEDEEDEERYDDEEDDDEMDDDEEDYEDDDGIVRKARGGRRKASRKSIKDDIRAALDEDDRYDDSDEGLYSDGNVSSSEAEGAGEEEEEEDKAATLEEVNKARLSRELLVRWMNEPFFEKLAAQCFVRVGIGQDRSKRQVYRMARVEGVVPRKAYTIPNGKAPATAKKALLLSGGGAKPKAFPMSQISNHRITQSEYDLWTRDQNDAGTFNSNPTNTKTCL